jgi:deazaflavin-dependent oxidoreductase (nitroreductase family)
LTQKHHEGIRRFNRIVINPITKLFAGRTIYSLLYHTGRRSGKEYSTPVVASKKGDYIFIPLPYGTDTDWFLNVQSANQCRVKIGGKIYISVDPKIITADIALSAFSDYLRKSFETTKINQFLRLRIEN